MKKYIILLLASIFMFSISSSIYAFKVDTHVWVGQQVINDLEEDGKLSFKLGNEIVKIAIDETITNAILSNKSDFLMGNIGPDAAPDVVVGQTVVHPGVKDEQGNNIGWQTNDWLGYLLSEAEISDTAKAYTYGYLGHAAADVFSHTYVNQYAGDIFSLADELLVEQRHFVLEGYIGKHTPPLKNYLGQDLGDSWDQITLDDTYAEFIRNSLVYNDAVQDEYWKVPLAKHLVAYYDFRKSVDTLAEDDLWHDIDVAVTMVVAAYFGVELMPDEASQVVDETNDVIDQLNAGSENVQEFTDKVYQRLSKYDDQVFGHLSSAMSRMQAAEQNWLAKQDEWRRKLLEFDPCNFTEEQVLTCFVLGVCTSGTEIIYDPICVAANEIILDATYQLELEILGLKDDLIQKTEEVRIEAINAVDSIHNIANAIIDLNQMISADVSPVQSVLRGWRSDIDLAMTAYVKATSQVMINTMNPAESALEPIVDWFDCYHMSIIGMPSAVSSCEFRDSIGELIASIENIILIIDEAASVGNLGLPSTAELIELKDNTMDSFVNKLKEKVSDKLVDMMPEEMQELVELLELDFSDAVLNQYFTKPETVFPTKGLFMIPDMAERVKAEMNITGTAFDPDKFPVAYNAVVLAKLALLDRYGFDQLAISAGSTDYNNYFIDNVVAQAFGNIDGNHQWMPIPPPLPNTKNNYPVVTETYSSDRSELGESGGLGFVPWKDDMRDKLFRKLFIGPLSPGIDIPSVIGKSRLVDSDYPYQPCYAYPYPNDINDRTCAAIMMIPITSLLLN